MGSFYVLCKVSTGPLVLQDNAPRVVGKEYCCTVPMLIVFFLAVGLGRGRLGTEWLRTAAHPSPWSEYGYEYALVSSQSAGVTGNPSPVPSINWGSA